MMPRNISAHLPLFAASFSFPRRKATAIGRREPPSPPYLGWKARIRRPIGRPPSPRPVAPYQVEARTPWNQGAIVPDAGPLSSSPSQLTPSLPSDQEPVLGSTNPPAEVTTVAASPSFVFICVAPLGLGCVSAPRCDSVLGRGPFHGSSPLIRAQRGGARGPFQAR